MKDISDDLSVVTRYLSLKDKFKLAGYDILLRLETHTFTINIIDSVGFSDDILCEARDLDQVEALWDKIK